MQDNAMARIQSHEAVCAERYGGINARLKRMEGMMFASFASVMGLMATVILRGAHLL